MGLVPEQPRSLPLCRDPELEARHPRIGRAVGVLEESIAESATPPQLKKEFAHSRPAAYPRVGGRSPASRHRVARDTEIVHRLRVSVSGCRRSSLWKTP